MTRKLCFLSLSFLMALNSFAQKTDKIHVYIEKLDLAPEFKFVGDSMLFADYKIGEKTVDAKAKLTDNYGSYVLILTDNLTGSTEKYIHKGSKQKYKLSTIQYVDGNYNEKLKTYRQKIFTPLLFSNTATVNNK